ncbi:MAG: hypothetical protein WAU01_01720 [Saprospiraceae bacterium]
MNLLVGIMICGIGCKPTSNGQTPTNIDQTIDQSSVDSTVQLLSVYKMENGAYVVPWQFLMNVHFEEKYSDTMGMEVSLPIFNDTLRVLDGKTVVVEGFFIPVDETGDEKIVILSAFPFSQCFFCGKAGVESIIDILSTTKLPRMKVDSKIKFKGRLKLNRDNFNYLIYVLEEAEMVK